MIPPRRVDVLAVARPAKSLHYVSAFRMGAVP